MVPVLLPPERGLFPEKPAVLIQRSVQIRSSAGDLAPQSGSTSSQRHHIRSKSLPPRHSWPPICPPLGLDRGGTPRGSLNCGNSEIMYVKYLVRKLTYSKQSVNINYYYYHIPQL